MCVNTSSACSCLTAQTQETTSHNLQCTGTAGLAVGQVQCKACNGMEPSAQNKHKKACSCGHGGIA